MLSWNKIYGKGADVAYPAEAVIRIFLGEFPNLIFDKNFSGKSILDLGYGDGRHLPLFKRLELRSSGVEITQEIVDNTLGKELFRVMISTCVEQLPATSPSTMLPSTT